MRFLTILMAMSAFSACKTVKPYEKEYLLGPLMDDAAIGALDATFARETTGKFEKLALGSGGGGGTSCPTCGG